MENKKFECIYACRNTCSMLDEALRDETAMMRFYERMMNECTYPDVQAFIREILEERSSAILRIVQKLNELKVRGQTIEDVRSSFNPVA
jgi:hypothetical protein